MSNKRKDPAQLGRIIGALLETAKNDDIEHLITTVYDAVGLVNSTVNRRNIKHYVPILLEIADTIQALADGLISNSYLDLRRNFSNIALNYVLLSIDTLRKQGNDEEADALFEGKAYNIALSMKSWDEHFPKAGFILNNLAWQKHTGPKLVVDAETYRPALTELHEAIEKRLARIRMNLDHARFVLKETEREVNSCEMLFEIHHLDMIIRYRDETPYSITSARCWLKTGEEHIEEFDAESGTDANVNHSDRVIHICRLVAARAKACLAYAYDEYWKTGKGYKNFEVLSHQAMAFAQALEGGNWQYYAPVVFIKPEEPLIDISLHEIRNLCDFGNAALQYARTLDMQMRMLPKRQRPEVKDRVEIPLIPEDRRDITAREMPKVRCGTLLNSKRHSQAEIAKTHQQYTGDDLREDHWLGIGRRSGPTYTVKHRLVGFANPRAGAKRRKRRQQKAA